MGVIHVDGYGDVDYQSVFTDEGIQNCISAMLGDVDISEWYHNIYQNGAIYYSPSTMIVSTGSSSILDDTIIFTSAFDLPIPATGEVIIDKLEICNADGVSICYVEFGDSAVTVTGTPEGTVGVTIRDYIQAFGNDTEPYGRT